MPKLTLTEDEQALLVLLSQRERDAVLLSLFAEQARPMGEAAAAVYRGILRRERARRLDAARSKRYRDGRRMRAGAPAALLPSAQPDRPAPPKVQWADHVAMTEAQHEKLLASYGRADTARLIEILDNYKGSTGKVYRDDYRAILSWCVRRLEEDKARAGGNVFLDMLREGETT